MAVKVEYCELAPGLQTSRVLTGLWQIADMERGGEKLDLKALIPFMQAYVNAGFTTFDMADHYGSAEDIAGLFKQELPTNSPVRFFTKWVPEPGISSKEKVRKAINRSLRRMQTNCLDMLQYHAWNYANPSWMDDLYWLQELQKEGLIQELGLTNFDTSHLQMVLSSGIKVVTNQICYSLLDQRAAKGMTQFCQKNGVKILAFGTLAGGFLTERWLGHSEPKQEQLTTWSQMKYKRFIEEAGGWELFQQLLSVLKKVAKKYQVSIANIASRYILEQPAVGGVIIGARLGESEHLSSNLRLFQFTLDEDSKTRIGNALQKLKPIPGDCGDEYRKKPFLTASGDLSHHLHEMPAPFQAQTDVFGREKVFSGTVWEDFAGYCRAIKTGNRILVSGTTATHRNRVIGGKDAAAQTHFIIDKIEGALQSLGSKLEDVVRTRIYVQHMADWEAVARAHGARFALIQPANTLIRADLIGDDYLVEIEAEAIVG